MDFDDERTKKYSLTQSFSFRAEAPLLEETLLFWAIVPNDSDKTKRASFNREYTWTSVQVQLQEEDRLVTYVLQVQEKTWIGQVDLQCTDLKFEKVSLPQSLKALSRSGNRLVDENSKPYMFELFVPVSEERYIFACPSEESRQKWVTSIDAVIKLPNVPNALSHSRRSSIASKSELDLTNGEELTFVNEFQKMYINGKIELGALPTGRKSLNRTVSLQQIALESKITLSVEKELENCYESLREEMKNMLCSIQPHLAVREETGAKRRPPTLQEKSRATTLANDVDIVYQLFKKTLRICKSWLNHDTQLQSVGKRTLSRTSAYKALKNLVSKTSLSEKNHFSTEAIVERSIQYIEGSPRKGKPDEVLIEQISAKLKLFASTNSQNQFNFFVAKTCRDTLHNKIARYISAVRYLTSQICILIRWMTKEKFTNSDYPIIFHTAYTAKTCVIYIIKLLNSFETLQYINNLRDSFYNVKEDTTEKSASQFILDYNIWKEKEDLTLDEENNNEIASGNLNQLIIYLTSFPDTSYINTFITTYKCFTTPYLLLHKLMQRFDGPEDEPTLPIIRTRVCIVINYWVEYQYEDFYPELALELENFLERIKTSSEAVGEVVKKVTSTVAKKKATQSQEHRITTTMFEPIQLSKSNVSMFNYFMHCDEEEIAKHLTVVEYSLFSQIKSSEFLNQSWNVPKLQYQSPNLISLIERANIISYWIASLILFNFKSEQRAKTITKFVKIALQLEKLCNYNGLISVIAGLNLSSITRLKLTWSHVEKSVVQNLKKLEDIFNSTSSHKNYRNARLVSSTKTSVMPYIGVTLQDLTHADESPTYLNEEESIINFQKCTVINGIIKDIQLNQNVPFSYRTIEPLFTYLSSLVYMDEKEIYSMSLEREPRGMDLSQLEQYEKQN